MEPTLGHQVCMAVDNHKGLTFQQGSFSRLSGNIKFKHFWRQGFEDSRDSIHVIRNFRSTSREQLLRSKFQSDDTGHNQPDAR
jgi:hypothetical protein